MSIPDISEDDRRFAPQDIELGWCRSTRTSASNAARGQNSPIKAHQINLQRSLIVELSTDSRASVSCFGFAVGTTAMDSANGLATS